MSRWTTLQSGFPSPFSSNLADVRIPFCVELIYDVHWFGERNQDIGVRSCRSMWTRVEVGLLDVMTFQFLEKVNFGRYPSSWRVRPVAVQGFHLFSLVSMATTKVWNPPARQQQDSKLNTGARFGTVPRS